MDMNENVLRRRVSSQLHPRQEDLDVLHYIIQNRNSFMQKDDESDHVQPNPPRNSFRNVSDMYERLNRKKYEKMETRPRLRSHKLENKKDKNRITFDDNQSTSATETDRTQEYMALISPSILSYEEQLSDFEKNEKRKEDRKKVLNYLKKDFANHIRYDPTIPKDDNAVRNILRLREKLKWKTEFTARGFEVKKAKDVRLKTPFMESLEIKDDGEYVYGLLRNRNEYRALYNPYEIQVVSANDARTCQEFWIITASFVSKITRVGKNEEIEMTPVMEWLVERTHFIAFRKIAFFVLFRERKSFLIWKNNIKRSKKDKST